MKSTVSTLFERLGTVSPECALERGTLTTFVNPHSYRLVRREKDVARYFRYVGIDGFSLVPFGRILSGRDVQRTSFDMTSIAKDVFEACSRMDRSIFLIGAKKKEIEKTSRILQGAFPKLNIVGFRDGYFKDNSEKASFINRLVVLNPDVVVVGMGTPRQERFLMQLVDAGWAGSGFTCGGFLHQTASGTRYYPDWVNRFSLRWLYRIVDEPRLLSRYFISYPIGLILFLFDGITQYGVQKTGG
ncbi:WecB/TagA/CpsF family glycosyltransferase [Methylohalobius crimeensis]|uniref:WecB/TagA/CpsF family glycosyltransferase n=1 Tax=Methylohalobius crimeensis TaxID=244365 RepID=UPI0003B542EB|nr:WecB/TagA/CpsF family glycosyltransferase [Methylohalobius crimeensis]